LVELFNLDHFDAHGSLLFVLLLFKYEKFLGSDMVFL
jgi:hypothetical protein